MTDYFGFRHDAVAAVTALIALISDPRACKSRMAELENAADRVSAAQAKLDTAAERHEQKLATDNAMLDARERKVRQREVDLAAREGMLRHEQQVLADSKIGRPRDSNLFATLTRAEA